MNRIALNIQYKMRYQLSWVVWYFAIFISIMVLLSYGLVKTSAIHSGEGGLFYRLCVSIIWQFAIAMRFKEDFDYLLTLSNTRKDILISLIGFIVGLSGLFSIFIVAEKHLIDHLNGVLGFHNFTDPFHFFSAYTLDNVFVQFLFFLMLGVCCSIVGLLLGSLFYRFGKRFLLAFWLVFSVIPVALFPLLLWPGRFHISLRATGEFLKSFDVTTGSGVLFLIAVVLTGLVYLNIRRLPQK